MSTYLFMFFVDCIFIFKNREICSTGVIGRVRVARVRCLPLVSPAFGAVRLRLRLCVCALPASCLHALISLL